MRITTCPCGSVVVAYRLIDYPESFGACWFHSRGCLQALGMDTVRALLGLRTTIGTVKEALPPPKSVLVDSFSALQNPDVSLGYVSYDYHCSYLAA